jgi:hypothetical protein
MWATILIYLFYAVLCSYLVVRIPLIRNSGLKPKVIIALFVLKLIGGLLYYYINTVRYYGADSHSTFVQTAEYLHQAYTNPQYFWHYFFKGWSSFHIDENIFSKKNSIGWSNLGNQLNFRFSIICNFLSCSKETVNYIFYNLVFFIGQIALFRFFANIYPSKKTIILLLLCFLPSIWFWCSGVHKDGFVLCFIGLMLFYLQRFKTIGHKKYFMYAMLFLLLCLLIRYYIIIALFPCLVMLLLSYKFPKQKLAIFILGTIVFIFAFFSISSIIPGIDPPAIICKKQAEFLSLIKGKSYVQTNPLLPTASNFLENLPISLNHCLMRPYLWEASDGMYFISGLETLCMFLGIIILIIGLQKSVVQDEYFWFCFIFSMLMFIIIGYIVPFSGAFIRYRSEYLPLIFGVLIGNNRWQFLDNWSEKAHRYLFL